jgi:protein-tyrosine phosphatase
MAEGLMQAKIDKYKLDAVVDSAGFEPYHTGDAPDYRATREMIRQGIDISHQRSRLFRKTDFNNFDRIYVMDRNNYEDVKSMADTSEQMKKVDYILNVTFPGSNKAVPDPYYGGDDGFARTFQMLDSATEVIAHELKDGGK